MKQFATVGELSQMFGMIERLSSKIARFEYATEQKSEAMTNALSYSEIRFWIEERDKAEKALKKVAREAVALFEVSEYDGIYNGLTARYAYEIIPALHGLRYYAFEIANNSR